ncbi:MAG TPA: DUF6493 family protein [Clostridia bacterium]|nr:DUF6493 family protein [Clostridia bacterium]
MPLSVEKLEKPLRGGDVTAVAKFFEGSSEPDRRSVAPQVVAWCERLNLNWRAQFNEKAKAEVKKAGAISNWHDLMPAANTAALACASLAEIKSIDRSGFVPVEMAPAILADRLPPWIADYAEWLCERELHTWGGNWKQVRALVKAGLCKPPKHDHYVLEALNGIWPRYEQGKSQPRLSDLLLQERDWLETDFWRLFQVDGNGEVSLANCEKYCKSKETWTKALVELSQQGVLPRERLLDASLAALSRDFIQFRAGWFSRFHETLQPTPAECVARVDVYLRLLASSIPPTVAFALDAVAVADKVQPLPAGKLAVALPPVLNARGKAVVKKALQLLDAAAKREPEQKPAMCNAALSAVLNETPDVQKSVFDFLDRHGDKQDAALRARLEEYAGAVAASLQSRLASWLGESAASSKRPSEVVAEKVAPQAVSRIDPARAIAPINDLGDLIHAASAVMEEPADPNEIERVLDGISRLCDQRPIDFEKRTGPLRKRAMQKREKSDKSWSWRPAIERGLAMTVLTWLESKDAFTETPEALGHGTNQYTFIFHRLKAIGRQVQARRAMPLLSAPTHLGGWIEPRALVKRWLLWQKSGLEMASHEQVLSLLRMTPEGRDKALPMAKEITGESGQAVRLALGEKIKTGNHAALWLAAWRSRQPFGDLPEFESKHPRLGPDAGVGARYEWQSQGERRHHEKLSWTRLKLETRTEPKCPKKLGSDLLPVLFHGTWETGEEGEKYLMRWATQFWPANREAMFARGSARLGLSVDYADVNDREYCAYVEPLAEPHTELRPMACLALALSLAAQDNALRGHAQDGLIAAISEGRVNVEELGHTMSRLLETGINKFARWAKVLRDVARISPEHTRVAADLITRALRGDPSKAPRDISALLELLFELMSETESHLKDQEAKNYLAGLKAGGKTAKLVKQLSR